MENPPSGLDAPVDGVVSLGKALVGPRCFVPNGHTHAAVRMLTSVAADEAPAGTVVDVAQNVAGDRGCELTTLPPDNPR